MVRGQGRQLQFTFGARFQRQELSQRFAQRQQSLGEAGDVQG